VKLRVNSKDVKNDRSYSELYIRSIAPGKRQIAGVRNRETEDKRQINATAFFLVKSNEQQASIQGTAS
jgi:hypothetical protein